VTLGSGYRDVIDAACCSGSPGSKRWPPTILAPKRWRRDRGPALELRWLAAGLPPEGQKREEGK